MPKVDESGQPISDAPGGDPDVSGGKIAGDPGLEDATVSGSEESPFTRQNPPPDQQLLPGDKPAYDH